MKLAVRNAQKFLSVCQYSRPVSPTFANIPHQVTFFSHHESIQMFLLMPWAKGRPHPQTVKLEIYKTNQQP